MIARSWERFVARRKGRRSARVAALALPLVALVAGCGGGSGADPAGGDTATAAAAGEPPKPPPLRAPPCPDDAGSCERATGRIVYVERVDPDGDGDAHFVLLSEASITAPGISVIDVAAGLRPDPLPRPGDELAAAGPVYRGSYGQQQIEADEIRVARR